MTRLIATVGASAFLLIAVFQPDEGTRPFAAAIVFALIANAYRPSGSR